MSLKRLISTHAAPLNWKKILLKRIFLSTYPEQNDFIPKQELYAYFFLTF